MHEWTCILVSLNFACLLCQNGKQMVQEGALTALASVADSSQVFYTNYALIRGYLLCNLSDSMAFFRSISKNTMMRLCLT